MTTKPDPATLADELERLARHTRDTLVPDHASLQWDITLGTMRHLLDSARELADLKARGVTMSQEHLDTLLRQEDKKALANLAERYPKGCIPDMYPFSKSHYDRGWNNAIAQVRHNIEQIRSRSTAAPGEEEKS